MSGISLGGLHTWFCASVDERVRVAAPVIGLNNFGWDVENNRFHGRVSSIPKVFHAAAESMGKEEVDQAVVRAVWDKLLPGLDHYDAVYSLPTLAPRPLLVVNGELDNRCNIEGLESVVDATRRAYSLNNASDKFLFHVEKGVGHTATDNMKAVVISWLDKHLPT